MSKRRRFDSKTSRIQALVKELGGRELVSSSDRLHNRKVRAAQEELIISTVREKEEDKFSKSSNIRTESNKT